VVCGFVWLVLASATSVPQMAHKLIRSDVRMSINKYSERNFTDQSTRRKEYSPQLDVEPGLVIVREVVAPTQNIKTKGAGRQRKRMRIGGLCLLSFVACWFSGRAQPMPRLIWFICENIVEFVPK
jgi:hypothetical protein